MLKVKICGITNIKDALAACNAGADALGFVFYPRSPRYISPFDAKMIAKELPPFVQKVGLFVNESSKSVNAIMKESKMSLAQIHFDAKESFYQELECDYIKVARIKTKEELLGLKTDEYRIVDAFVDSYGGEGKRIELDWFDGVDCSKMIIAGGLNEQNVKELKGYGFYGVDVSSGVEKAKGKKEHKKMYDFIETVKNL